MHMVQSKIKAACAVRIHAFVLKGGVHSLKGLGA